MKLKRILFIGSLLILFGVCFVTMNQHYDPLARYPYESKLSKSDRELIVQKLSTDDIGYLTSQQIQPEQFLPYIQLSGFELRNTLWYDVAKHTQDAANQDIVTFVNKYRENMSYTTLPELLSNYTYAVLEDFYDNGDGFMGSEKLISDPSQLSTMRSKNGTWFRYEPKDLALLSDVPHTGTSMKLRQEAIEPLKELCEGAASINGKTCGNMIVTSAYVSYEEQQPLYEAALLHYGQDAFMKYEDYPGYSEHQLGYTVTFTVAEADGKAPDSETLGKEEQAKWLAGNAYKYGFIVRYPKDKETRTGKLYQPYTIRYVGKGNAKKMNKENILFEDMKFEDEKTTGND